MADYADIYGVVVDPALSNYVASRIRQESCLHDLRLRASELLFFVFLLRFVRLRVLVCACPFTEPKVIDTYVSATEEYLVDFGYPFKGEDGIDEYLDKMKTLQKHHRKLMALDRDRRNQLVARSAYVLHIKNPFPWNDPRREELDKKSTLLISIAE